jgi:septum formation protein
VHMPTRVKNHSHMSELARSPREIILASTSAIRAQLLRQAGISFTTATPDVDETALKAQWSTLSVDKIAPALAEIKSRTVSAKPENHGKLIIGADQTLIFTGRVIDKCNTLVDAEATLLALRGHTHHLHSAVCVSSNGQTLFSHVSTAALTMRQFTTEFLSAYLKQEQSHLLSSVGCYRLEGPGIQLFSEIDGDYFAILGLPLLPLLAFLRSQVENVKP